MEELQILYYLAAGVLVWLRSMSRERWTLRSARRNIPSRWCSL